MTTEQLLESIKETGSFSETARRLGISPSFISTSPDLAILKKAREEAARTIRVGKHRVRQQRRCTITDEELAEAVLKAGGFMNAARELGIKLDRSALLTRPKTRAAIRQVIEQSKLEVAERKKARSDSKVRFGGLSHGVDVEAIIKLCKTGLTVRQAVTQLGGTFSPTLAQQVSRYKKNKAKRDNT